MAWRGDSGSRKDLKNMLGPFQLFAAPPADQAWVRGEGGPLHPLPGRLAHTSLAVAVTSCLS